MHLNTGSLLQGGKYRVESVLGQGGFGITYLAEQTALGRKVAVKEFFMKDFNSREVGSDFVSLPSAGSLQLVEKFKAKFLKEARTIAALNHSNIIRIHDVFEENGTAYYVMEYHGCGSLAGMEMPMPADRAVSFVRQICSALSYLHRFHIMHLDIKPANVLVGEDDNAVLIDFGISKRYDETGYQTSSTPAGISQGYAPLEQYTQSALTFSPSTDIYAVGATMYKLLTGKTPPEASIVNDEGLPRIPEYVPDSLAVAIERAMQPKRKDRPQTMEEFMKLLDAWNSSVSHDSSWKTDIPEAGQEVEVKKTAIGRKRRKWPWVLLLMIVAVCGGIGCWWYLNKEVEIGPVCGVYADHEYVDLGLPSGVRWAMYNVGDGPEYEEGNVHLWGEGWRVPTEDNLKELVEKCDWESVTYKGQKGMKVTGPNGKSIFLPAEGYVPPSRKEAVETDSGFYLSDSDDHQILYFKEDMYGNSARKYKGKYSVRMVF